MNTFKKIILMFLILGGYAYSALVKAVSKIIGKNIKEYSLDDMINHINYIIDTLEIDICKYIGIDKLPEFRMGPNLIEDNYILILGQFWHNDNIEVDNNEYYSTYETLPDLKMRNGINNNIKSCFAISLYPKSIFEFAKGNKFLFIMITALNIVHECTHYRQYIKDDNTFTDYIQNDKYEEYLQQECEKEARKMGSLFAFRYIFKIFKIYITRNNAKEINILEDF